LGFIVPLISEGAIEIALKHEALKFVLCGTPVQKLTGAEAANYGEVQKQRVAQQFANPLVRSEVSLRQKYLPLRVYLG